MSKSDAFENDLIKLIFTNADAANIGDATAVRASTPAGSLYFSLHTADPGEAGNQSTSEAAYTGYARKGLARNGTNFTVSGNQVTLAANLDFDACTAGTATVTHFGIGTANSGAGKLLYSGTVTPNINVSNGVTPRLTTSTTVTED